MDEHDPHRLALLVIGRRHDQRPEQTGCQRQAGRGPEIRQHRPAYAHETRRVGKAGQHRAAFPVVSRIGSRMKHRISSAFLAMRQHQPAARKAAARGLRRLSFYRCPLMTRIDARPLLMSDRVIAFPKFLSGKRRA